MKKIAGLRKRLKPKAKKKEPAPKAEKRASVVFERVMVIIFLLAFLLALIFGKGGPGQGSYRGRAYEAARSGSH